MATQEVLPPGSGNTSHGSADSGGGQKSMLELLSITDAAVKALNKSTSSHGSKTSKHGDDQSAPVSDRSQKSAHSVHSATSAQSARSAGSGVSGASRTSQALETSVKSQQSAKSAGSQLSAHSAVSQHSKQSISQHSQRSGISQHSRFSHASQYSQDSRHSSVKSQNLQSVRDASHDSGVISKTHTETERGKARATTLPDSQFEDLARDRSSDESTTASDILIRSTVENPATVVHGYTGSNGNSSSMSSKCSKTSYGAENFNTSGPHKVKISKKHLREIKPPFDDDSPRTSESSDGKVPSSFLGGVQKHRENGAQNTKGSARSTNGKEEVISSNDSNGEKAIAVAKSYPRALGTGSSNNQDPIKVDKVRKSADKPYENVNMAVQPKRAASKFDTKSQSSTSSSKTVEMHEHVTSGGAISQEPVVNTGHIHLDQANILYRSTPKYRVERHSPPKTQTRIGIEDGKGDIPEKKNLLLDLDDSMEIITAHARDSSTSSTQPEIVTVTERIVTVSAQNSASPSSTISDIVAPATSPIARVTSPLETLHSAGHKLRDDAGSNSGKTANLDESSTIPPALPRSHLPEQDDMDYNNSGQRQSSNEPGTKTQWFSRQVTGKGLQQGGMVNGHEAPDRQKDQDVHISDFKMTSKEKLAKVAFASRQGGPVKRVVQPKLVGVEGRTGQGQTRSPGKRRAQHTDVGQSSEVLTVAAAASAAVAATQPFVKAQQEMELKMAELLRKLDELQGGKAGTAGTATTTGPQSERVRQLEQQIADMTERRIDYMERLQEQQMAMQAKLLSMTRDGSGRGTEHLPQSRSFSPSQSRSFSPEAKVRKAFTKTTVSSHPSKFETSGGSRYIDDEESISPLSTPAPRARAPRPTINTSDIDVEIRKARSRSPPKGKSPKSRSPKRSSSRTRSKSPEKDSGILQQILAMQGSPTLGVRPYMNPRTSPVQARYNTEHLLQESPNVKKAKSLIDDLSHIKDQVQGLVEDKENYKVDVSCSLPNVTECAETSHMGPWPLDNYLKLSKEGAIVPPTSVGPELSFSHYNAPVLPGFKDAKKILQQVQENRGVLEANFDTVMRERHEVEVYSMLEALYDDSTDHEKSRIRSMVDKSIQKLRREVEREVTDDMVISALNKKASVPGAVKLPEPAAAPKKGSRYGVHSRLYQAKAEPKVEPKKSNVTVKKPAARTGGKESVYAQHRLSRPPIKKAAKSMYEDEAEISRVFGKASYQKGRTTVKDPYLHYQNTSKPKVARPVHKEIKGTEMMSSKTQTTGTGGGAAMKQFYFNPTTGTYIPVATMQYIPPIPGQLIPMAVPLGDPRMDNGMKSAGGLQPGTSQFSQVTADRNVAMVTVGMEEQEQDARLPELGKQVLPAVDIDTDLSEISETIEDNLVTTPERKPKKHVQIMSPSGSPNKSLAKGHYEESFHEDSDEEEANSDGEVAAPSTRSTQKFSRRVPFQVNKAGSDSKLAILDRGRKSYKSRNTVSRSSHNIDTRHSSTKATHQQTNVENSGEEDEEDSSNNSDTSVVSRPPSHKHKHCCCQHADTDSYSHQKHGRTGSSVVTKAKSCYDVTSRDIRDKGVSHPSSMNRVKPSKSCLVRTESDRDVVVRTRSGSGVDLVHVTQSKSSVSFRPSDSGIMMTESESRSGVDIAQSRSSVLHEKRGSDSGIMVTDSERDVTASRVASRSGLDIAQYPASRVASRSGLDIALEYPTQSQSSHITKSRSCLSYHKPTSDAGIMVTDSERDVTASRVASRSGLYIAQYPASRGASRSGLDIALYPTKSRSSHITQSRSCLSNHKPTSESNIALQESEEENSNSNSSASISSASKSSSTKSKSHKHKTKLQAVVRADSNRKSGLDCPTHKLSISRSVHSKGNDALDAAVEDEQNRPDSPPPTPPRPVPQDRQNSAQGGEESDVDLPKKIKSRSKESQSSSKEKVLSRSKESQSSSKEKVQSKSKESQSSSKEKVQSSSSESQSTIKEKVKSKSKESQSKVKSRSKESQSAIKERVFAEYKASSDDSSLSTPGIAEANLPYDKQHSSDATSPEDDVETATGLEIPGYQQDEMVQAQHDGVSFPPKLPPADRQMTAELIAADIRRRDLLQNNTMDWLEQELMARIITEMYPLKDVEEPPELHHEVSEMSQDSMAEEKEQSMFVMDTIGHRGMQLFVDTGVPVDNSLVNQLVSEVLQDKIRTMLGQRPDQEAGTSHQAPPKGVSDEPEWEEPISETHSVQSQQRVNQIVTPEPTPRASPRSSPPRQVVPTATPPASPPQAPSRPEPEPVTEPVVPQPVMQQVTQPVFEPESEPESSASYDIMEEMGRLAGKLQPVVDPVNSVRSRHDIATPPRSPSPVLPEPARPLTPPALSPREIKEEPFMMSQSVVPAGTSLERSPSRVSKIGSPKSATSPQVTDLAEEELAEDQPKAVVFTVAETQTEKAEEVARPKTPPTRKPRSRSPSESSYTESSSISDTYNECISEGQWLIDKSDGEVADYPICGDAIRERMLQQLPRKVDVSSASTWKDMDDVDLNEMNEHSQSEGEVKYRSDFPPEKDPVLDLLSRLHNVGPQVGMYNMSYKQVTDVLNTTGKSEGEVLLAAAPGQQYHRQPQYDQQQHEYDQQQHEYDRQQAQYQRQQGQSQRRQPQFEKQVQYERHVEYVQDTEYDRSSRTQMYPERDFSQGVPQHSKSRLSKSGPGRVRSPQGGARSPQPVVYMSQDDVSPRHSSPHKRAPSPQYRPQSPQPRVSFEGDNIGQPRPSSPTRGILKRSSTFDSYGGMSSGGKSPTSTGRITAGGRQPQAKGMMMSGGRTASQGKSQKKPTQVSKTSTMPEMRSSGGARIVNVRNSNEARDSLENTGGSRHPESDRGTMTPDQMNLEALLQSGYLSQSFSQSGNYSQSFSQSEGQAGRLGQGQSMMSSLRSSADFRASRTSGGGQSLGYSYGTESSMSMSELQKLATHGTGSNKKLQMSLTLPTGREDSDLSEIDITDGNTK